MICLNWAEGSALRRLLVIKGNPVGLNSSCSGLYELEMNFNKKGDRLVPASLFMKLSLERCSGAVFSGFGLVDLYGPAVELCAVEFLDG